MKSVSTVPEYKKKQVINLVEKIKSSKTILIASTKGLPSSQFHKIKKQLRGKAEIKVAKKSIVLRAIGKIEKGALQNLKAQLGSDIALFFSDLDAFELSALLADSQSPARAKAGDLAPEDIIVESGPTELIPGPAISELSSVGLKVAVENGKIAVKQQKTIVKEGAEINEAQANVMTKLNISPMKVGFEPIAAFDADSDKVYVGIKIDKPGTLEALRLFISQAIKLSLNISFPTKENISQLLAKANAEEIALSNLVEEKAEKTSEEKSKVEKTKPNKEEAQTPDNKVEEKPNLSPTPDLKKKDNNAPEPSKVKANITQKSNNNNDKEEKS